jgi:molybdenum cofactor cytidylyltransferase
MIPILILAAGASSRMRGRDKLLEIVDGMPLLRQRALAALGVSAQVFITLPAPNHPRAMALNGLAVKIIPIPDATTGMSASLRHGVAALPECNHFMVLLADLPEITRADMTSLATQIDPDHLIFRGQTTDGTPGHPIIFDTSLRPLFADLTGDNGGKDIITAHRTKLITLPDQHATRDLDTPEDWAAWRAQTNR